MPILSLTSINKPTLHHHQHHRRRHSSKTTTILSCTKIPSSPPGQLYQPFRPPPPPSSSPLPAKYLALNPDQRLDILRDRLGLWHEYAPLISSLISAHGYSPPSIEDITGISSIQQNCLLVASQVRDSLLLSSPDPHVLAFFDAADGTELLYELRLLNVAQRAAAARYVVETNINNRKLAQELAKAMRDFPKRRGDDGWKSFSADSPADCLAYTHFRLSKEVLGIPDKLAALEKAMGIVETDEARRIIGEEMEKVSEEVDSLSDEKSLPVVRLRYGEVAEAASVVILPACKASEGVARVEEAPLSCKLGGELGVVVAAEKGWGRWMVLPGWSTVVGLGEGGLAVEGLPMPWKVGRWENEEQVIVVVDRKKKEVSEGDGDGFYLVVVSGEAKKGELGIERGSEVVEKGGMEVLGAVVLVVRPPKDEELN